MKYIVFTNPIGTFSVAVFDESMVHKDIALAARRSRLKPDSAGFCRRSAEGVWGCWGDSESLHLKAYARRDSVLLDLALNQGLSGNDLMNLLALGEIMLEKEEQSGNPGPKV